jgi:hypothetical protein
VAPSTTTCCCLLQVGWLTGSGKGKPPAAVAAAGAGAGAAGGGGAEAAEGAPAAAEEMTLRADLGAAEWSKLQELVAVQVGGLVLLGRTEGLQEGAGACATLALRARAPHRLCA